MYFIGIDLGTSALKLLLVDRQGTVLRTVTREYPLLFPQSSWSEQEPAHWWQAVREGIPALLQGFDAEKVAGIGAGGQMHGLVALDEANQVIRPAILWNDGRTFREVEYLNGTVGKERLSALTANIAFAGFTAPKLLWMQRNEPESFRRICCIMLPKDYINYKLTGVHCCDYSDASGMLLPEVAAELGLPAGVKVCAGAGDNAAAAVGTGVVGAGGCNISLGTSGTIFISSDKFGVDPHNGLHAFAHADGGYHLMGCMLSAASCNKWFMEEILGSEDYAGLQARISPEKLGHNHVYFLPYLMGERSPINDTSARGTFIGMTMDTSRADMLQAVLEGVAFAIRDSFEVARSLGIAIPRSMICGGGSKSSLWRQMIADILGIPLDIPVTEQGPGYGGAMLAMVACGVFENVQQAAEKLIRVKDTVQPDPERMALYEKRYQQFRQIYPACRELFKVLER